MLTTVLPPKQKPMAPSLSASTPGSFASSFSAGSASFARPAWFAAPAHCPACWGSRVVLPSPYMSATKVTYPCSASSRARIFG